MLLNMTSHFPQRGVIPNLASPRGYATA